MPHLDHSPMLAVTLGVTQDNIDLDQLLIHLESRTVPVYVGNGNVDEFPDTECHLAAKVIRKLIDFIPESARTTIKVTS